MTSTLFSEQTFNQVSAAPDSIYYGVPVNFTIVETGTPTDFYLTIGTSLQRDTISKIFGWGEFTPSKKFTWTPDSIYTNVRAGIHTSPRNLNSFSIYPTDSTDFEFTVQRADGTISLKEDSIWFNDNFLIEWQVDLNTVPTNMILQYRESGSNWVTLDTVMSNLGSINIVNNFITKNVKFRLTYLGSEFGYSIAKTNWIQFKDPSLTITNRTDLELPVIWKDSDTISVNFTTNLISEYSKILVDVFENGILVRTDELPWNSTSYKYITPLDKGTITDLNFKTNWNYPLTSIQLNTDNKYFEVNPVNIEYHVNDIITFNWSASLHFETVKVEVFKNKSTTSLVLNKFWDITKPFDYIITPEDTTLQFKFTVKDKYSELVENSHKINIVGFCRDVELQKDIDSLNVIISQLNIDKDSLIVKIETLENTPTDTVIVVLIKDVSTNVEEKYTVNLKTLKTIDIENNYLELEDVASNIYVVNSIGTIIQSENWTNKLFLDNSISSGSYILVYIINGKTYIYKFIKI